MIDSYFKKYQIPLPFKDDEDFEEFTVKLFNEIHETDSFKTYGRRGQAQNGFDIYSTNPNYKVVIECKKKIIYNRVDLADTQAELLRELEEKLEEAVKVRDKFKFNKFILISTFEDDAVIEAKAQELSSNYENLEVCYWGSHEIMKRLVTYPRLMEEYAPQALWKSIINFNKNKPKKHLKCDKNTPLIEQIHNSISALYPLKIFKPYTFNNLPPFKESNRYIYSFKQHELTIENRATANFLENSPNIFVDKDDNIIIKDELEKKEDIIDHIEEYKEVLSSFVYNRLYYANSILDKKEFNLPNLTFENQCDCIHCNYYDLNFNAVFTKLKANNKQGKQLNFDDRYKTAYINYKVGNFSQSYKHLKQIEKESIKEGGEKSTISIFLSRYNITKLYIFFSRGYRREDRNKILKEIEKIELDKTLQDNDIYAEVLEQLLWIKENKFINSTSREIDDSLFKIRESYNRKYNVQDSVLPIIHKTIEAYWFIKFNNLFYDKFDDFEVLIEKVLDGYLASYSVKNNYYENHRISGHPIVNNLHFNDFWIELATHYCKSDKLIKLFDRYSLKELSIGHPNSSDFLTRVKNFLDSGKELSKHIKENNKHSYGFFEDLYNRLFNNLMIILAKADIEDPFDNFQLHREFKKLLPNIIAFVEQGLPYIKRFEGLIVLLDYEHKGTYCETAQLEKIAEILLFNKSRDSSRYDIQQAISNTLYSIYRNSERNGLNYKVKNKYLLNYIKHVSSSSNEKVKSYKLVSLINYWWHLLDSVHQNYIKEAVIKFLDEDFNFEVYNDAAVNNIIHYNHHNYFQKAIDYLQNSKCTGEYNVANDEKAMMIENGDIALLDFIDLVYTIDEVNLNDPRIQSFARISEYYNWLLNLDNYDYSKFKLEWLLIHPYGKYFDKFKEVDKLKSKIKKELKKEYNPTIAKWYFELLQ